MKDSRFRVAIIGAPLILLSIFSNVRLFGIISFFDILILVLVVLMMDEALKLMSLRGFHTRPWVSHSVGCFLFILFLTNRVPNWVNHTLYIISIGLIFFSLRRFRVPDHKKFTLGSMLPVFWGILPPLYLISIKRHDCGSMILFYLFILIWSNDSFAYFIGCRYGKHKLAPRISPNKTIEGSLAGIGISLLTGIAFYFFRPDDKVWILSHFIPMAGISIFLAILGQIGDLLESRLKRLADIKDSSNIFFGHGGALDRFDGFLLAAPAAYFLFF